MYDVAYYAMKVANKKQVEEYYETTKLMSLDKFMVDSGLGAVEIHPNLLELALREEEVVVTVQDIILTAMIESANFGQLAKYYANMTSSKTISSFLRESGAGKIEVNAMEFIKALNEGRNDHE